MSTPKIGILGFSLESNRFAPVTTEDDFKRVCYLTGQDIIKEAMKPVPNIKAEAVGFVKTMNAKGPWEPAPTVFARTTPGGPVDHAFFLETMKAMQGGLKAYAPLDGVYIANHGAMSSTETTDPDGLLYEMVRREVGPDVPIVATVDLHANISRRMFENADAIISYLTNPHVDGAERAADAAGLLLEMIKGLKLSKAFLPTAICAPSVTLLTARGPYADLVRAGQKEIGPDLRICSVVGGFAFTDGPECGINLLAYGHGDRPARVVEKLARMAWEDRARYNPSLTSLPEAMKMAVSAGQNPELPAVCLADVADNPGGGGTGNTTDMLEALLESKAQKVLLGLFHDPALATACHEAGEGAVFEAEINSQTDAPFARKLRKKVEVLQLSDGETAGRRGISAGIAIRMGLSAAVRIDGVTLAVNSSRMPGNDPACFESLGLDPGSFRSMVIKSRGHFRAGFDEFFKDEQIIEVDADGLTTPILSRLDFKGLRRPSYPLDGDFDWHIPNPLVMG
jgi:microcystin degradation protein MlrC